MEISFLHPVYLWFLMSIPLLVMIHFFSLKFTMRRAIMFANFDAIKRAGKGLYGGQVLSKNIILLIIRLFTLLLLVLGMAGITIWYQGTASSIDFVLAIDCSGSMLADDFSPNRLEAAKEAAKEFLSSISQKSKAGIISFSGVSYIKKRLDETEKHPKDIVDTIRVEYSSGTAIGDAIITDANMFNDPSRARAIILLTDGQNTVGMPLEQAVAYSQKSKVTINTIGVGTKEGGMMEDMITTIDEDGLKYIASASGGEFFRAASIDELKEAYKEIASTTEQKVSFNLSLVFIMLALALIFLEWALINTRYRTIP